MTSSISYIALVSEGFAEGWHHYTLLYPINTTLHRQFLLTVSNSTVADVGIKELECARTVHL